MPEAEDILFQPFTLGDQTLPNRIVMAPLNDWDTSTFYGAAARGNTDDPTLAAAR